MLGIPAPQPSLHVTTPTKGWRSETLRHFTASEAEREPTKLASQALSAKRASLENVYNTVASQLRAIFSAEQAEALKKNAYKKGTSEKMGSRRNEAISALRPFRTNARELAALVSLIRACLFETLTLRFSSCSSPGLYTLRAKDETHPFCGPHVPGEGTEHCKPTSF
ncbi:hypothetical protein MTO96_047890 [Rhipicephalus appendiculatus]